MIQAFGAPFIVAEVQGKPQVFAGNDRYEVIADIISNINLRQSITLILLL